jgi:LAO/AO transport system kinase
MSQSVDPSSLAVQVRTADVQAVSRLITLIENHDPEGLATLKLLETAPAAARIIGITGYPGAGKSTLIAGLVSSYRRQGRKVGVLAVDASSPLSGGALLGDRIRMQDHAGDPGVFIRSMATRGHRGGLTETCPHVIRVLDAAGYEVILVETVGVGQNEIEIADMVQTVVAVVAPGLGDEIQAMKAGLLEIAHIVVVNKADRDPAGTTARDLQEWVPVVLQTIAVKGEGISELMAAIEAHRS